MQGYLDSSGAGVLNFGQSLILDYVHSMWAHAVKVLMRMLICAGLSEPWLVAHAIGDKPCVILSCQPRVTVT